MDKDSDLTEARERLAHFTEEAKVAPLLLKILDCMPLAIAIRDREGRFMLVNRRAAKAIGRPIARILGHVPRDIWPRAIADQMIDDDGIVRLTGHPSVQEGRIDIGGGDTWIVTSRYLIDGDEGFVLVTAADVTDRKRVELGIRDHEALVRKVIDASPNIIFVKDASGRFVIVNQAMADLFGCDKTDLLNKTADSIHPHLPEVVRFQRADRRVLERGQPLETVETLTRPDGTTARYRSVKEPIDWFAGNTYVLGVLTEIGERAVPAATPAIQSALHDLEMAAEALSTMCGPNAAENLTIIRSGISRIQSALGLPPPASRSPDAPMPPEPASGVDPGPDGCRILLVEDNSTNQLVATAMLNRAGYDVTAVSTGAEAIAAVEKRDHDVVLMDVNLPGMDGLEATRRIRALKGDVGNVPVIAMTAYALPEDVKACRDAGMNDFVGKPVTRDRLVAAIVRVQMGQGEPAPWPDRV